MISGMSELIMSGNASIASASLKVMLEYIGEGWEGDYDSEDPEDTPLLRFTVYKMMNGEWIELDNGSYCTQLPAVLPESIIQKALSYLMVNLGDNPGKRLMEQLSWIKPGDLFEGTEGQDRESYSDDQDRENYTVECPTGSCDDSCRGCSCPCHQ